MDFAAHDPAGPAPPLRPVEQLELLDVLSSLGSALGSNSGETSRILQTLHTHLRQLFPLHAAAFYLVRPESSEFVLENCDPDEHAADIRHAVDAAIDSGTFAWALRQNRPLFIHHAQEASTLILHSIATRARHIGMFAGIVRDSRVREGDLGVRLLGIMLMQGAYALENAALQLRIMRQNSELEAMVRERTSQLEVALKAAQDSSVVKSRFLANMSHEIRTPMNGILGLTELLEGTPLTAEQRTDLKTLRECGQNLLTILSEILDYSKIEAGKLVLEQQPFALRDLIDESLRLMTPLAQRKGLTLVSEVDEAVPHVLEGDEMRVRQVVLNLIGNAIKFTETGVITVELRPTHSVSDNANAPFVVRLDVHDTGIGIDPEVMENLFKPFTQADASTTRLYGGTGLGLAICKSLCNLMGGDIWVTSERGRGSTFSFELPFTVGRLDSPSEPKERRPVFDTGLAEAHPLRILMIDDSSMNQLVVCRMLTKMGYAPAVATGGHEGLIVARQEDFDLILLDLQMPDIDGYTVLRELTNSLPIDKLPNIVAMTANSVQETREKCIAAGFDDFLAAPFTSADLKAVLLSTEPLSTR